MAPARSAALGGTGGLMQRACVGAACAFLPHPKNGDRPYLLRHPVLAFLNALLLAATLGVSLLISLTPEVARLATITAPVLSRLANAERERSGLPPLKEHPLLTQAARLKGEHMLRHDYFEHTSLDGLTPWVWFDRVGYDYRYAGENLAIDFLEAEGVVSAWLRSPGHRRNLLSDRYDEEGFAAVTGEFQGRTTTIVVHLFGRQRGTRAAAARGTATTASPLPAPAILEPASGTRVSGSAVTVRGTAEAGSTVRISLDQTLAGTVPAPDGRFTATVRLPADTERLAVLTATSVLGGVESRPSLARQILLDTKAPDIRPEISLVLPDPSGVPGHVLLVVPAPPDIARATVSSAGQHPLPLHRAGAVLTTSLPFPADALTLRVSDTHGNTKAVALQPVASYTTTGGAAATPRFQVASIASRLRPWLGGLLGIFAALLAANIIWHLRFRRLLHADLLAHALIVVVLGTTLVALT